MIEESSDLGSREVVLRLVVPFDTNRKNIVSRYSMYDLNTMFKITKKIEIILHVNNGPK